MKTYWTNTLAEGHAQQLLIEQFKLRKHLFVDKLKWHLKTINGLEADQYDTLHASYCLTEKDGKLISSARIIPTDTDLVTSTYMIRDAALGKLEPSISQNLCTGYAPPCSEKIWEATRLTVHPDLPKTEKRTAIASTIDRMMIEARRNAITHYIAIGGIDLALGVRTAGYNAERLTDFQEVGSGRVAIYKLAAVHL
ncbi:acyl-homoserine-lactone synthase [Phaeobacter gallaeciensis]|uniref:acyl-homoserine-lactone synthase n=1 Tax=Phaeobacter gallaeciensis TaxID=60890 RepID=UPI0003D69DDC|nr:acyl-homoserine-lactone synthase [Phaeobacter gallaeciensis]AHD12164.1 N-acyl-L-homoserine lactone synthetase [Phaeobacter gallaeciensis DSM 26640]ATE95348.1 N-acyl-L-homoserine lactone synthetase [Phaeobacter gallaeciensis]